MNVSSDRMVLLSLMLASFVALVAMSSLNVALPAISEDLGASAVQASWIVMAFAFVQAIGMYPASWLAEKFGRKRIYLSGLILMGCHPVAGFGGYRSTVFDCPENGSGSRCGIGIRHGKRDYCFCVST